MRGDGIVVLVDHRGYLLLHKGQEPAHAGPEPIRHYPNYALFQQAVRDKQGKGEYLDPLNGEVSVAGYANIGSDQDPDGCWAAVVQHGRARVLQPIDNLRWRQLVVSSWVVVGGLIVVALTVYLIRRRPRPETPVPAVAGTGSKSRPFPVDS
jgi:hypothetical protein